MQQTIWITNNSFITELLCYQTVFKGTIFYILTNNLFSSFVNEFTCSLQRITNNTTSKNSKTMLHIIITLNKGPNTSYMHTYKVKVDPLALSH